MSRPAWLFVALLAAPALSAAQEEPRTDPPPATGPATAEEPTPASRPPQAAKSLADAARERADVTFAPGQPIGEVLRGLADRHGVAIEFETPDLADLPVQVENEIALRGVPFEIALGYAVRQAGLDHVPRDGVIVIRQRQAADRTPPADKIRAALRQPTRLDFPNVPLREAIRFLADSRDVNIIIDETELTEAGVGIDDNIDLVLSGITLADALNLMLESWGLTWVTTNDVLLVTTPARAAREIDTRSYDVSSIVGDRGYATEAADIVTRLLEPRSALASAMIAAEGGPPVPLPQPRVVSYKQQLLVTASWADQRRVEEILRLMEGAGGPDPERRERTGGAR